MIDDVSIDEGRVSASIRKLARIRELLEAHDGVERVLGLHPHVTTSDIMSLLPNKHISSSALDAATKLYISDNACTSIVSNTVCVTEGDFVTKIMSQDEKLALHTLTADIRSAGERDARMIIMPAQVGAHWYVTVIDHSEREIWRIDSNKNKQSVEHFLVLCRKLEAGGVLLLTDYKQCTRRTQECEDYDCAVFAYHVVTSVYCSDKRVGVSSYHFSMTQRQISDTREAMFTSVAHSVVMDDNGHFVTPVTSASIPQDHTPLITLQQPQPRLVQQRVPTATAAQLRRPPQQAHPATLTSNTVDRGCQTAGANLHTVAGILSAANLQQCIRANAMKRAKWDYTPSAPRERQAPAPSEPANMGSPLYMSGAQRKLASKRFEQLLGPLRDRATDLFAQISADDVGGCNAWRSQADALADDFESLLLEQVVNVAPLLLKQQRMYANRSENIMSRRIELTRSLLRCADRCPYDTVETLLGTMRRHYGSVDHIIQPSANELYNRAVYIKRITEVKLRLCKTRKHHQYQQRSRTQQKYVNWCKAHYNTRKRMVLRRLLSMEQQRQCTITQDAILQYEADASASICSRDAAVQELTLPQVLAQTCSKPEHTGVMAELQRQGHQPQSLLAAPAVSAQAAAACTAPISVEEVQQAVSSIKFDVSSADYGLYPLKCCGPNACYVLSVIMTFYLYSRSRGTRNKHHRTVLTLKTDGDVPRDANQYGNWRQITMQQALAALYDRVLAARLQALDRDAGITSPLQKGFKIGVEGCLHHIVEYTGVCRAAENRKGGSNLFTVMVDIAAAFDNMSRARVREELLANNVPQMLIDVVADAMTDLSTRIRTGDGLTDCIRWDARMIQGSPLTPVVFNLFLARYVKLMQFHCGGFRVAISGALHIVYGGYFADDGRHHCESIEHTSLVIECMFIGLKRLGLSANPRKCAVIVPTKQKCVHIFMMNGVIVPVIVATTPVKYLGTFVVQEGAALQKQEVERRMADTAVECLASVVTSRLEPLQMVDAIKVWAIPKLSYHVSCQDLSLNVLQRLDSLIVYTIKTEILQLPKSTNSAFIHAPSNVGGLQVPSLVLMYSHVKANVYFRCMTQTVTPLLPYIIASEIAAASTKLRLLKAAECTDDMQVRRLDVTPAQPSDDQCDVLFTGSACVDEGKQRAIAAFAVIRADQRPGDVANSTGPVQGVQSAQRAALTAALAAVEMSNEAFPLVVHVTSDYVVKCVSDVCLSPAIRTLSSNRDIVTTLLRLVANRCKPVYFRLTPAAKSPLAEVQFTQMGEQMARAEISRLATLRALPATPDATQADDDAWRARIRTLQQQPATQTTGGDVHKQYCTGTVSDLVFSHTNHVMQWNKSRTAILPCKHGNQAIIAVLSMFNRLRCKVTWMDEVKKYNITCVITGKQVNHAAFSKAGKQWASVLAMTEWQSCKSQGIYSSLYPETHVLSHHMLSPWCTMRDYEVRSFVRARNNCLKTNVVLHRYDSTISNLCRNGCVAKPETQHHLLSCSQRSTLWTTRHNRVAKLVLDCAKQVPEWVVTDGEHMTRDQPLNATRTLVCPPSTVVRHYKPDMIVSTGNTVVIIDFGGVDDHQLYEEYKRKLDKYREFKLELLRQQPQLTVKRIPYMIGQLGYLCPTTVRKMKTVFGGLRSTSAAAGNFSKHLAAMHKGAATIMAKFVVIATSDRQRLD